MHFFSQQFLNPEKEQPELIVVKEEMPEVDDRLSDQEQKGESLYVLLRPG